MTANARLFERGASALRRGRHSAANQIYHVTTATHNRAPLFRRFASGRIVVDALRREESLQRCRTLCFVVMPDHLHWLMQITQGSLTICVNSIKACSARRINSERRRRGPVWQKGFHDHAVRREEDLTGIVQHIIANPLRAGLVDHVGDYPLWDSLWL